MTNQTDETLRQLKQLFESGSEEENVWLTVQEVPAAVFMEQYGTEATAVVRVIKKGAV